MVLRALAAETHSLHDLTSSSVVYGQRYPRLQDLNHGPQRRLDLRRAREGLRPRAAGRGRAWSRTAIDDDRRFHLIGAEGRLLNGKQLAPLVQIVAELGRGDPASSRSASPTGEVVSGSVELGESVTTNFYGRRDVEGRLVEGPWSEAISTFVGRPLRLVQPVEPGAGRDRRPASVSLLSTGSLEAMREAGGVAEPIDPRRFRMLFGVDGVDPHEEDTWIGRRVRVGQAEVELCGNVGRCIVTSRNPETGARRSADARHPRRVPPRRRDHRAAAVRRLGQGDGAGTRAARRRRRPRLRPPCTRSSPPSRPTSTTPTPASRRCGGRSSAPARPGIGEIEALVLEAWARKRLAHVRGRRARPLLRPARPRRRPPAALRRAPLGARGADADRRQLAGAGRARLLHRDRRRPAGRRAPPPLPRPRAARLLDLYDEPLDGSAGDVIHGVADILLEELERSRDEHMRDIVATIQTDQYRLITREPEGVLVIQGGPGTGKTAVGLHRASWLLYTYRRELERSGVLVVGPNPVFMDYISHVLPMLGEERVEQRAVDELVDGRRGGAVATQPALARLKGDARLADVIAAAVRALPQPPEELLAIRLEGVELRLSPERGRRADRGGAGGVGRPRRRAASACG